MCFDHTSDPLGSHNLLLTLLTLLSDSENPQGAYQSVTQAADEELQGKALGHVSRPPATPTGSTV